MISLFKANAQKNTLLQAAQGNAEPKAFKRVFFLPPNKNFFPPFLFFIKLFPQRTGAVRKLTAIATNVNHFGDSLVRTLNGDYCGQERRASANI